MRCAPVNPRRTAGTHGRAAAAKMVKCNGATDETGKSEIRNPNDESNPKPE
jgi:hypothetical protein